LFGGGFFGGLWPTEEPNFYGSTMFHTTRIKLVQICLPALLWAGPVFGADWTNYIDDFSTKKAQSDSYLHSTFWTSEDGSPLPGSYLQYLGTAAARGLLFMDYRDQPAELGYCVSYDAAQTRRMITGTISFDVSFPCNAEVSQFPPGELFCSVSADGMAWSEKQSLWEGRQSVPFRSPEGKCYIRLSGGRAMIDNVRVSVATMPASIRVPSGGRIQQALDAARDGDVVEVVAGTYTGTGNWDLDFRGKQITLRSVDGPRGTIIRCDEGHRGFYFHQGETAGSVLSGFTIRGGRIHGASNPGGGIYCEYSSPTLLNCVIEDCSAELGGGIGCVGGEPTIGSCTITDCLASSFGAGLYLLDSRAVVAGCTLSDNLASGSVRGGGAYCSGDTAEVTFRNCLVTGNYANAGAGILVVSDGYGWGSRCRVEIVNCTIARNRLTAAYGGSAGGVDAGNADVTIVNSIVWGNDGAGVAPSYGIDVRYSDIQGGYSGQGNLAGDPRFTSASDYHLGTLSPCIDAGDPGFSAAAEPAPNGSRINMGVYGGTTAARQSTDRQTLHVDVRSGRDSYDGSSKTHAFATIRRAVERARDGDAILVWPGVYQEEITFKGKAIIMQSAADAAVITAPSSHAFSFYGAESSRSILSNFVIAGCGESGIYCDGASPTLKNLTLVQNAIGIEGFGGADPNIINCILWENVGAALFQCRARYSCIEPTDYDLRMGNIGWADGNIDDDPLFADSLNGDYHLKSRYGRYTPQSGTWVLDSTTSPCIDAGDPSEYPRDERMPNGSRINMGAYGGTVYASLSSGPACP